MEKKKLSIKETADLKRVISYMEDIVKSLKAGKVCLVKGSEFITLKPSSLVSFEMEGTARKGKEKLAFEVTWVQGEEMKEECEELKISSSEPEGDTESSPVTQISPAVDKGSKKKTT